METLLQATHLPNLKSLGWAYMDAISTDCFVQVLGRGGCDGLETLVVEGSDLDDRRLAMLCSALTLGKRSHRCALSLRELYLKSAPGWAVWASHHNTILCSALADGRFAPALEGLKIDALKQNGEEETLRECITARRAKMGTAFCLNEILCEDIEDVENSDED